MRAPFMYPTAGAGAGTPMHTCLVTPFFQWRISTVALSPPVYHCPRLKLNTYPVQKARKKLSLFTAFIGACRVQPCSARATLPPLPSTEGLKVIPSSGRAIILCVRPDAGFDINYNDGEEEAGIRADMLYVHYLNLLFPKTFKLRSACRDVYAAAHGLICVIDGACLS
jgi:hypothetical protein